MGHVAVHSTAVCTRRVADGIASLSYQTPPLTDPISSCCALTPTPHCRLREIFCCDTDRNAPGGQGGRAAFLRATAQFQYSKVVPIKAEITAKAAENADLKGRLVDTNQQMEVAVAQAGKSAETQAAVEAELEAEPPGAQPAPAGTHAMHELTKPTHLDAEAVFGPFTHCKGMSALAVNDYKYWGGERHNVNMMSALMHVGILHESPW